MSGETDLGRLLRTLDVAQREGVYVFVDLPPGRPLPDAPVSAVITEMEGTTVVMRESDAEQAGLSGDFRSAWLTLTVHSSLEAIGLTASVATALAVDGIPANVIAGYRHDHILVPVERAADAMASIRAAAEPPEDPATS